MWWCGEEFGVGYYRWLRGCLVLWRGVCWLWMDGGSSCVVTAVKRVISQCKTIPQLHQLHAHTITTTGLHHSTSLLTHLLHSFTLVAASSSPPPPSIGNYALSLFTLIPNPSAFCYNTIIRTHTITSSPFPALSFFARMRRSSVPPDSHTFPFVLKACSLLRSLPLALALHSQALKFGLSTDLFLRNSLISAYCSCGHVCDAHRVFDECFVRDPVSYNALIDGFVKAGDIEAAQRLFSGMPERDTVSWGTLLAGHAQLDRCEDAIELFDQMIELGFKPDNVALVSALSACAQLGDLLKGKAIHDYIGRRRIQVDAFLCTGLVDLYAKCGCIDTARGVFRSSRVKNLFTWNAMIAGLAMSGHGKLCLDYFLEMRETKIQPDGVTILGVLVGCSHSGLVHEAQRIFEEMEEIYGVPREQKHYGCMVDLLGRAGLIAEVMTMMKGMPVQGDVFAWGGLLNGCRIHGNVEVAEKVAEHIMAFCPEDGGVYSVMAGLYADQRQWDDALRVRRALSSAKRVKKKSGFSLVEVNGVAHKFLAGDTSHPRNVEIYFALDGYGKHQLEACSLS